MRRPLLALLTLLPALPLLAADHFLTLGGGSSPSNTQVSLEKNVLYLQRILSDLNFTSPHTIFFADGDSPGRDLQFEDPKHEPPKVNQLLAEVFDQSADLFVQFRSSAIPSVAGPSTRRSISQFFSATAAKLKDGDRLFIYFTGHGGRGRPERNTTLELWGENPMPVREFFDLLEKVPPAVQVVLVMVQCHAGGFADVIFDKAQVGDALSGARRCGFFATVPDRSAAGCTADIDEDDYHEYSTYFFAALSGKDRLGKKIDPPDYNSDGRTGFDEAHAYVMLHSDTIDIPIATSDVFLRQFSKSQLEGQRLFTPDAHFDALIERANPSQRAVLEGLSHKLRVYSPTRTNEVRRLIEKLDRDRKAGEQSQTRLTNEYNRIRRSIASRIKARWPELSNPWNPKVPDILKADSDAIAQLIEGHPSFKRWDQLTRQINDQGERSTELERQWVKCHRFLYIAESVALAANLEKVAAEEIRGRYKSLLAAEADSLVRP